MKESTAAERFLASSPSVDASRPRDARAARCVFLLVRGKDTVSRMGGYDGGQEERDATPRKEIID